MKLNKLMGVLAMAGLVAPGLALATNGYFSHGYGMKAKGMAGVGIALPQDALAAATNPAGMVFVGDRLDVGLDWFRPIRDSEIVSSVGPIPGVSGNYNGSDQKNFFVPEFGYNKMLGWNMSLGVSVYGNGGMNTNYKNGIGMVFDAVTPSSRAGVDLMQLFIAPTFAYKITKDHAVGVSLNLAYQRFKAYGLQNFAMPAPFNASSSPNDVTNNGYDSSTGWGIRIGYTGNLTDAVTVGATYQSRTRMSKFSDYKGLFAEQGDFDIPENYGIGIAVKATPKLTVAADIQHISYGSIDSISNSRSAPGFLGADNGPGFGWRDMNIFKLGVSYAYSDKLTLRAGLSTTRQPIPKGETFFNILAPGVIENHLTLGATWALSPASELSLAYMHAFSKKVKGSGSFIPGVAEVDLKMYQDSLGIAYGMKF